MTVNYQLLIIFILLNFVNVILQTIKSLLTITGTKFVSAMANAIAFGLYTVVVIYTVCELPLWLKIIVTMITNFFGVYVSKWLLDKFSKDKLWKVEVTVPTKYISAIHLDFNSVPHNYITISDKYTLFNFYCATQKESAKVKDIVNQYGAKYFVAESKTL